MKKIICLAIVLLFLSGCSGKYKSTSNDNVFIKKENGNLISEWGVEYTHLANESVLYYLGELEFVGGVEGEKKTFKHLSGTLKTGMFSIKNSANDNVLIRRIPDNEWYAVYRKASLPQFDFSADNSIRLEFVSGGGYIKDNATHTTCKGGITDKTEIATFLSEVRTQKSPKEAGVYDLVTQPDGSFNNCYVYGVVYGFFEAEPNLAIIMEIMSYNDLAYSITLEGKSYVLPNNWLKNFKSLKCTE